MESKKKKKKAGIIEKKVIRKISAGTHYVCKKPVEYTEKVFADFFPLLKKFYNK